jgi:hypothetical protein
MITFKKADLVPLGLITGGILILIYIFSKYYQAKSVDATNPSDLTNAIPPLQDSAQTYPNAGIVPAGASISIGGSPLYLDYNTPNPFPPTAETGANGAGCDSGCGCGTGFSTQITIPQGSLDSQLKNIKSLFASQKPVASVPASSVPAPSARPARSTVTFSEAG